MSACAFNGCLGAAGVAFEDPLLDDDGMHLRTESFAVDAAVSLDGLAVPTAAAGDLDGECRPAVGADVGADQVTPP